MKIKLIFISILFNLINFNYAFSVNFKNYSELDKCLNEYVTFTNYKFQLKKCFKDQGINIKNESIKLIKKRSGIINDIINLNLPNKESVAKKKSFKQKLNEIFNPDLEKIAQEYFVYNKKSALLKKAQQSCFWNCAGMGRQ